MTAREVAAQAGRAQAAGWGALLNLLKYYQ
jgi:hypothetical protein